MIESCSAVSEEQIKSAAVKWILKHREGHRIPQSVMESIVSGAQSLFRLGTSSMEHLIAKTMKDSNVSADLISSVVAIISDKSDIFKGLATMYQQNEYIKANFQYLVSTIIMHPMSNYLFIHVQP